MASVAADIEGERELALDVLEPVHDATRHLKPPQGNTLPTSGSRCAVQLTSGDVREVDLGAEIIELGGIGAGASPFTLPSLQSPVEHRPGAEPPRGPKHGGRRGELGRDFFCVGMDRADGAGGRDRS